MEGLRTGEGRFALGVCPNPGGRPRKTDDERKAEEFLRKRTVQYARKLHALVFDPDTSETGVLRALELALAYGLGKPSVRDDSGLPAGLTIVVQAAPVPQGPVPGVTNSPIKSHLGLPRPSVDRITTLEAAP